MSDKNKAKRKLSDIDFQKESAHIALVNKAQGGPANGADYALILKAKGSDTSEESDEVYLQKMQEVQVVMQLPEFLRRMFDMYYSDAEALARFLGYDPKLADMKEDAAEGESESTEEEDPYEVEYEKFLAERIANFTILKAASSEGKLIEAVAGLTPKQQFLLVKSQADLEKFFIDKPEGQSKGTKTEKSMDEELQKAKELDLQKAALVDLQKSFDLQKVDLEKAQSELKELQVQLTKANEAVAAFEAEKVAAKVALRKAALAAVTSEAKVEVLLKATASADDEEFNTLVESLQEAKTAIEKSALFQEQGASTDDKESAKESGVAAVLKAKLNK